MDVLPQQAPDSAALLNLLWAPATCCLLCWDAVAGPRPAVGCETPPGPAMCCPWPRSPAVPVPPRACRWGLSCGHQLPLLCFWAFRFSHDPFVLPTVCALPFFFLKRKHKRFLLASLLLFKRAVFLNTIFFLACFFSFFFFFLTASALSLSIFPWACSRP